MGVPGDAARGLPVPGLLLHLLQHREWRHPGDDALARAMPWFTDPLRFLDSVEEMGRESRSLDLLGADEATARVFRFARGSTAGPVPLPWLDVDAALLVAVAEHAGDDTAVALDYRTSSSDPRVVASDIWTDPSACTWRVIAETFSAFVDELGLGEPSACR